MKKNWFVVLFILGVAFRLWFINAFPQPIVYDQLNYREFALKIIEKGLYADNYRLYGYPLLLAPVFYFFGENAVLPWQIMQAVMDTSVAFMIYYLSRRLFKSKTPSFISLFLYLFNPFTSAYVGMILTEIPAIFFLAFSFLLIFKFFEKDNLALGSLTALVLGFLPQIRPTFVFFTAAVLVFMIIRVIKRRFSRRLKIIFITTSLLLYLLPFTYNLVANWVYFDEPVPLSVDNVLVREIYTSLFIDRMLPDGNPAVYYPWPYEVIQTWGTYSAKEKTVRQQNAQKYARLALEKIRQDPNTFLVSRLQKMWYVWEKHYLFPYIVESRNMVINALVYWGNILLLGLAAAGLTYSLRKTLKVCLGRQYFFAHLPKSLHCVPHSGTRGVQVGGSAQKHCFPADFFIIYLTLFLFAYISLVHMFSTSEERYSLPAYPLVFLFAGFSLFVILNKLKAAFPRK